LFWEFLFSLLGLLFSSAFLPFSAVIVGEPQQPPFNIQSLTTFFPSVSYHSSLMSTFFQSIIRVVLSLIFFYPIPPSTVLIYCL
jgi:hypothetical protein